MRTTKTRSYCIKFSKEFLIYGLKSCSKLECVFGVKLMKKIEYKLKFGYNNRYHSILLNLGCSNRITVRFGKFIFFPQILLD